ncbi:NAD-dependent formate dehydrogenase flavoprotein subunit [Plasticicumulans lactativorans]|uniref:NADH-quinone oxidoreductase subunit F n=1 Tax=Plasticicumulans lactativorans TaxID=1133106 RepID=A0A4R2L830_9GAMM|nr:NAD(P)H-dependent oxidoreductase subunit E [Plasticicumulans lactativorans]TCO82816.1 NAD-dependent formate dehydrogenase flavoprotein subunit [Plasticicumulans lactativorans]
MASEQARGGRRRGGPRGHAVDPAARAEVEALLDGSARSREHLIEHLHRLQDRYGHLSAAHLVALAEWLRLAPVEVYEVASFYHHFDVLAPGEAPPPLTVRVCASVSCALFGAGALADALAATLGPGVRVRRVPCVGRCDTAPVAIVGDRPVPYANPAKVVAQLAAGTDAPVQRPAWLDYAAYRARGGYALLQACVAGRRPLDAVLATLADAGLRGLGGAGFPAARKWQTVRGYPGPRLLVANLDEGEPGTFKDRHCLETDPHRFFEGLLIAAWAVEAAAVYLYVRDEYPECRALLAAELAALAADPPCALPPIHLRRGAGAYICGEESALIESIEGRRGMPRLRPPYVAERGLFGRPTLAHNVETLYWLREILERGADWFRGHGRHGRQGLRAYSVSGRVVRPGVKLAPAGITLNELVDEHCGGLLPGHTLYAYFPGGASGGILPAHLADLPLDFDTLQPYGCFIGSAAVIVLSQHDSVRAAALNAMRFFADESCGQCTPCRVGTARAAGLMAQPVWDAALLADLATVMREASICGLGQAAPNTFACALKYFPEEFDRPGGAP